MVGIIPIIVREIKMVAGKDDQQLSLEMLIMMIIVFLRVRHVDRVLLSLYIYI